MAPLTPSNDAPGSGVNLDQVVLQLSSMLNLALQFPAILCLAMVRS